jgi:hypothetical protein
VRALLRQGDSGCRRRRQLPLAPEDVAYRFAAKALVEGSDDLRLEQLQLLHPDGLVDAYFQPVIANAQRRGMGGDLLADDLGPDLPDLVLFEFFRHSPAGNQLFEEGSGLLRPFADPVMVHRCCRRRNRPPMTWPATAQPMVKGMIRQLTPRKRRRATISGMERWI